MTTSLASECAELSAAPVADRNRASRSSATHSPRAETWTTTERGLHPHPTAPSGVVDTTEALLVDGQPRNDRTSCQLLVAFDDTVKRKQAGGVLAAGDATVLLTRSQEIHTAIGC